MHLLTTIRERKQTENVIQYQFITDKGEISATVQRCLYFISYYYAVQHKRQGWNLISEAIVRPNPSVSNLFCFICLSIQSSPKAYTLLFR